MAQGAFPLKKNETGWSILGDDHPDIPNELPFHRVQRGERSAQHQAENPDIEATPIPEEALGPDGEAMPAYAGSSFATPHYVAKLHREMSSSNPHTEADTQVIGGDATVTVDTVELSNKARQNPYFGFVHPETLETMLASAKSPYVRELPSDVVSAYGTADDIYSSLDKLTSLLRDKKPDEMTYSLGKSGREAKIQKIGEGAYCTVYQISGEGHSPYALKVYHKLRGATGTRSYGDPYTYEHGAYAEIAVGQYLLLQGATKDAAQFYTGNPKAGWSMAEYITPDMRPETRAGISVRELPVWLGDINSVAKPDNEINGIIVDFGDIHPSQPQWTLEQVIGMMTKGNLDTRARFASKIPDLPESDRIKAFEIAIKTGNAEIQRSAAYTIVHLPEGDRMKAFEIAMKTGNAEIQRNTVYAVGSLPEAQLPRAIELVMGSDNPEAKAFVVRKMQQ